MLTAKQVEDRFSEHHDRIHRVEIDMYFGDGKENPPIVTRIDRVEKITEDATNNHNQIKWALYAGLFLLLANLIGAHLKF